MTAIAACLVGAAAEDKAGFVASREVGRYQIQESGTTVVWLVDTATGRVWQRTAGTWSNKGTPVPEK